MIHFPSDGWVRRPVGKKEQLNKKNDVIPGGRPRVFGLEPRDNAGSRTRLIEMVVIFDSGRVFHDPASYAREFIPSRFNGQRAKEQYLRDLKSPRNIGGLNTKKTYLENLYYFKAKPLNGLTNEMIIWIT